MRIAASLSGSVDRYADLSGVRLHYIEVPGDGPPMLMLHGIGMDWRVWQAISRRLRPFFHLYLLDLRGHGWSSKCEQGYTLSHYAADVEDLLDKLRLEDVILTGSSLGGMVTASVEAPIDVVSHRILVDPPLTGGPVRDEDMFREILRLKREPVTKLSEYLGRFNPGAGHLYLRIMAEMWHEAAEGVIRDLLADPTGYFDVDAALQADEAPTLIMQADRAFGGVLTDAQAQRALRLLPHGALTTFPGAGHAVHAFQPAQFVKTILEFVRGTVPHPVEI